MMFKPGADVIDNLQTLIFQRPLLHRRAEPDGGKWYRAIVTNPNCIRDQAGFSLSTQTIYLQPRKRSRSVHCSIDYALDKSCIGFPVDNDIGSWWKCHKAVSAFMIDYLLLV